VLDREPKTTGQTRGEIPKRSYAMNYRGLIGAGGLGAIALAVIAKAGQIPANVLGFILGGMGVVLVILVAFDTFRAKQPRFEAGSSGPQDEVRVPAATTPRKLIYVACSRKRPNVVSTAKSHGGEVFDSFVSKPTRREARDAMKTARAVIAVIEAGDRRENVLIELGLALLDKQLYLLVARHRDQPDLSVIEPVRSRAAYLTFDSDRDLEEQLRPYWGYVHTGNDVSKEPPQD
jgi:hypothetical protein